MALKIQDVVFWVLRPCSDVIGYQSFEWLFYHHLRVKGSDGVGRDL